MEQYILLVVEGWASYPLDSLSSVSHRFGLVMMVPVRMRDLEVLSHRSWTLL
jgi:hypothetical protein